MRILFVCCIISALMAPAARAQGCGPMIATINAQGPDSLITPQRLAQADSLVFTRDECNHLFRIYTFELRVNGRTYHTYGNRFSTEMKTALRNRKVGDVLYFSKIKTRDRSNPDQIRMIADHALRVAPND